ncbi:MAG: hypothetical protein KGQ59_08510, partial [Bdellovibrionales bacterium]|nr:hypothetical protein [Bdellovibrionales bacterium]
ITPEGVFETSVALKVEGLTSKVELLATRAQALVARVGTGAVQSLNEFSAQPGHYCSSCSYQAQCDARKIP